MRTLLTNPCIIVLLGVMGLMSSLHACGQLQTLPDDPKPQKAKKKSDKTDFFYDVSRWSLVGATVADDVTTAQGLDHPTSAYTSSGKFLTNYYVREVGWAKFLGNRNVFAATAGNAALNAGVDFAGRRLDKRGGRWRIAAIALVAGRSAISATAAVHNIRLEQGIDHQVSLATGYKGLIVWRP
jgi:hypothetical protein